MEKCQIVDCGNRARVVITRAHIKRLIRIEALVEGSVVEKTDNLYCYQCAIVAMHTEFTTWMVST